MIVLGIETATERLGAALIDGDRVFDRHTDSRSSHCELLAGFIGELTAEAGVEMAGIGGVAVSIGPGSFTGLRIGIATAMGLAYGLGIEAAGIDTLAAIAAHAPGDGLLCPLIDAKRREAYAAVYRVGAGMPETIIEPAALPLLKLGALIAGLGEPVRLTGPAAAMFHDQLSDAVGLDLPVVTGEAAKPSAVSVARLGLQVFAQGGGADPAQLTPLYLRRSDAEILRDKKAGCRP